MPNFATSAVMASRPLAYILDDDACIRMLVRQFLVTCGYEAREFSTVLPFIEETKRIAPTLVVLDLTLGESDAGDVLRQLESLRYGGNVLLISGRDATVLHEVEKIGKAHGLAMLPPLQKPFRLADMRNRLTAALERDIKAD